MGLLIKCLHRSIVLCFSTKIHTSSVHNITLFKNKNSIFSSDMRAGYFLVLFPQQCTKVTLALDAISEETQGFSSLFVELLDREQK